MEMVATDFILVGIEHPGVVNIYPHGTLVLSKISNELAKELYEKGCKYLAPSPTSKKSPVKVVEVSLPNNTQRKKPGGKNKK